MSSTPQPPLLGRWAGNMYAPRWAGVTPQLPGFCDVDFDYSLGNAGDFFVTVSLGPGVISLKNPVAIDTDADYLAREIYVAPLPGSTLGVSAHINPQDLKIRVRDADGQAITSDWVTANDLCGPLGPSPLPFAKGGLVLIDLWNQGDGTLLVQMGFKGWKRFPCSETQDPIPAFIPQSRRFCVEQPGQRFEDYEYFYEFANGSNTLYPPWVTNLQPQSPGQIFARLSLQTEQDADFLWRGTTGMIMQHGGPISQVPDQFFLTFYDRDQIALQNQVPHPGITPTPSGPSAEMLISNGGGRMSPHWPEVFIPRGAPVLVDILLKTPATGLSRVQVSLRGVKVYTDADCRLS